MSPQAGDRYTVLHSCTTHGTGLATFTATKVTKLANRREYRITATRCDGTTIEFTTDTAGHDRHGYVQPERNHQ